MNTSTSLLRNPCPWFSMPSRPAGSLHRSAVRLRLYLALLSRAPGLALPQCATLVAPSSEIPLLEDLEMRSVRTLSKRMCTVQAHSELGIVRRSRCPRLRQNREDVDLLAFRAPHETGTLHVGAGETCVVLRTVLRPHRVRTATNEGTEAKSFALWTRAVLLQNLPPVNSAVRRFFAVDVVLEFAINMPPDEFW